MESIEAVLPAVPKVVFADLLNRTQAATSYIVSNLTREFNAAYKIYQEQQKQNKSLLKPSFASPDSKPALDALCAQEKSRHQQACTLILTFRYFFNYHFILCRKNLLDCQTTNADLFSRRVIFFSVNLMTLFDTTVATVDLNLPGIIAFSVF